MSVTTKKLKNLPIGQQTFEDIILQNKLYVDKTGEIYKLLKPGVRYFLSRPRRFGKSLTCSTLEAIFQGKRELFKGLAIDALPYDWQRRVVLKFDFSVIDHKSDAMLTKALLNNIDACAAEHGIVLRHEFLKGKLAELIQKLAALHGPIAVIVDEYDKPLLDVLADLDKAKKIQEVLRDFYSVFKGGDVDAVLDFLFITGVTKFAKTSIFSAINNLDDISLDVSSAALVGYTQQDVEHNFQAYIQALADFEKMSYADMLIKIKNWYNGYQFSRNKNVTVYNPFSLHNCLTKKEFFNYWFRSGTPTFLIDFVNNNPQIATEIPGVEHDVLAASDLDAFSLDLYYEHYKSILVQAGYLTIRDVKSEGSIFTLAYPNEEVRKSMTEQIMAHVLHVSKEKFYGFVDEFRKALAAHDMNAFCQLMRDFYATIPYVVHSEMWYQNVFYVICKFLGFDVVVEHASEKGRMDAAIKVPGRLIVIELKRDKTPDRALKQIEDREYWKIFTTVPVTMPATLVGISCALSKKGTAQLFWKIKEVNELKKRGM